MSVSTITAATNNNVTRIDENDDVAFAAHRSTIGCIIPAHNEAESIGAVLESLLAQTRVPDVIHVVVDDSSDDTLQVADAFAGPHAIVVDGVVHYTQVYVHDLGDNPGTETGALADGFELLHGCDFLLEVYSDTTADPTAVERLEEEIASDVSTGPRSRFAAWDEV